MTSIVNGETADVAQALPVSPEAGSPPDPQEPAAPPPDVPAAVSEPPDPGDPTSTSPSETAKCRIEFENEMAGLLADLAAEKKIDFKLVGKLVETVPRLYTCDQGKIYRSGTITAKLIGLAGTEPHKVKTAGRALNNLRFRSNKNGAIYGVLTGLLCIIIFYTVLGSTYYASRDHISPGMLHGLQTMKVYLMGAVFGILGGIVSVTSRLSSYQQNLGGSRFFFVAMGITQPVIGSIFAIITIAIFEMKIISFAQVSISPLLDGDPTTLPFVIVVGFIAGFSERFTRGLIEKVAGMTGDAPDPGKPAPVAAPQATLPTLEAAND